MLQTLSIFICGLIVIFYLYFKYQYTHWKRLNIDFLPPKFPFGNFSETFRFKVTFAENSKLLYDKCKGLPLIGVFFMYRPSLLICDASLARDILIKNAHHFPNRGIHYDEDSDKLSGSLFFLTGKKWKNLRANLTPAFTTGKLKMMFQTIVDCGDILNKKLAHIEQTTKVIDARDLFARYTINIILSVAFGVEIDCIHNKKDEVFYDMGMDIFRPTFNNLLRQFFNLMMPGVAKILKTRVSAPEMEAFMIPFVKKNLEYREQNNIVRKDFFHLLLELRNTGTVKLDDEWDHNFTDAKYKCLSIEEVSAQAFVFFAAGFETSSTTMTYCLYELSKNRELQTRVQKEIDDVIVNHENKINYDSLSEMKYLESCIDETLRKYPPLAFLNRECEIPYRVPQTKITIPKGTPINIPVLAMHRDPVNYPDPMKFDPDRFYIKENINPNAPYFPFGDGPHICIGMRLGKMTTKIGLVTLLSKYSFELVNKVDELKFLPKCSLLTIDSLMLNITKRN